MKNIASDIKNKSFKPIYLLYGDEQYLKTACLRQLRQAIVGEDAMNLSEYTDKVDVKELISVAGTLPFFADRRLIVLNRVSLFKNNNDEINELMDNIPSYLTVVIVEDNVDKRKTLYKIINKKGYICEISRLSDGDLTKWAVKKLSDTGFKIRGSTVSHLLSRTGNDMNNIDNELEKIISYCEGREEITTDDIDDIVIFQPQERVFEMIEAICAGRKEKALKLYYDSIALKEAPLKILTLLERNYIGILQTKSGNGKLPDSELAKLIGSKGVMRFVVEKYKRFASMYSTERLKQLIREFALIEGDIKTGKISDRNGTELMIISAMKGI
ncbi:MAG: DNA polymerase III subunit delta [Lachnospiraceae bacterium]|nr:DNA polymerase III subunit delta [Lachnospiraceae bacterium]